MFENAEKRATSSLIFSLSASPFTMSIDDKVFLAQANTIKKVAEEGNCVIVGACADYVLKGMKNCINVFIHSNIENRKKRAVDEYNMPSENIEKSVVKIDKTRATYYVHYTDNKWGKANNYDISLDSEIGIDASVEIIKSYIKAKLNK